MGHFRGPASGSPGAGGGVGGPGSSTDNAYMRWNGSSGNSAQDSKATEDDNGLAHFRATGYGQFSNDEIFTVENEDVPTTGQEKDCSVRLRARVWNGAAQTADWWIVNAPVTGGSYGNLSFWWSLNGAAASEKFRLNSAGRFVFFEDAIPTADGGGDLGTASFRFNEFFAKTRITNDGELKHAGATAGFYGSTPASQQDVTGSRGGNAALASLLTALDTIGLITDSSS